ncbi:MAG: GNAT family N-acetyltransferase [Defluviitaleaceae bacterium]|nr:GNAT family N-acetyltransferase [Defluviitaleaceae bacterium]
MARIIELDKARIPQAKALVAQVFRHQDLTERMSFWAYKHQSTPVVKTLLKLYGYMAVFRYWVALNENDEICGTTGLYAEKDDFHEALWLSWFCVNPNMRGQGIGKQLLEFSIDTAREYKKKYLRLYTSDDPNEAAAQFLYEKYGFRIVRTEKKRGYTLLYRELALKG